MNNVEIISSTSAKSRYKALHSDLCQIVDNANFTGGETALIKRGLGHLLSRAAMFVDGENLSTQELAYIKCTSESSVSSVKKSIAAGKSDFETIEDWVLNIKKEKETKSKERTKAAIQKMDKAELKSMLAGLGIEIK